MTRISIADATTLIAETLERSRTSPKNAQSVARALVAAELAGQPSHGLRRVAAYCAQAAAKKVDGFAMPTLEQMRPAAALVDARHGFAYPALDLAVADLPQRARQNGIALCGIKRSHHCGVAGVTVERLAKQGLIALMVANAPAAMAPWGGRRPLFGTNPIGFAAPVADQDPIIVDISLSKVARGKVMAAQQKGEPIPSDWAFAPDGTPTTDADAAMAGTMAPMGGAKGVALALMVEMLSAGLVGANFSFEASSFFNDQGAPPAVGQTLIAIDPGALGAAESVLERFAYLAGEIAREPGARVPGRRRQEIGRACETEGIEADQALLDEIAAIGR